MGRSRPRRLLSKLPPDWFRIGGHVGAYAEDGIAFELVETRERDRGFRVNGMARARFDIVHRYAAYGASVDTGTMDPAAAADAVLAACSPHWG